MRDAALKIFPTTYGISSEGGLVMLEVLSVVYDLRALLHGYVYCLCHLDNLSSDKGITMPYWRKAEVLLDLGSIFVRIRCDSDPEDLFLQYCRADKRGAVGEILGPY